MSEATLPKMSWAERAAERSPVVQRSRSRSVEQAKAIVAAAQRLIADKGPNFTTQELVKEAGIALQTFYRYFPGKDQLLLAVLEDVISQGSLQYREAAEGIEDPVERLHSHITAVVKGLDPNRPQAGFIPSEHWRLQAIYPEEVSRAIQPFGDLMVEEIQAATASGQLHPVDPEYSAWLVQHLVMAVFHHYSFVPTEEPLDVIAERLWAFCYAALGGARPSAPQTGAVQTAPQTGAVQTAPQTGAVQTAPQTGAIHSKGRRRGK